MILITGGTGFVGKEIVRRLRKQGHRVRILARRQPRHGDFSKDSGVEFFRGDISREETIRGCCKGVRAVLHLVGILMPAKGNTYESAHVTATRHILAEAKRESVSRYIHMSAIGTRPNAASRYHQTKWDAEELVRNSGLNWTIFRPSLIYGVEDQFVGLFVKMLSFPWNIFSLRTLPCLGDGKVIFKPIAVDEVADCFVRSIPLPDSNHQVIDLVGQAITFQNLLETISHALGENPYFLDYPLYELPFRIPLALIFKSRPVIFPIPYPIVRMLAAIRERISGCETLFGPPITREVVKMLEENHGGDSRLAKELFDLNPRSFAKGISTFLKPR